MPNVRRALGVSSALPGVALLLLGCTGSIMSGPTTGGASGDNGSSSTPGGSDPGGGGPGAGPGGGSGPGGGGGGPPPPVNSAPGVAQLRRLTILEYRNTIRDLLGVDDAQMPDLAGDQQARGSGYTTGAAITTATDVRKLLDGAEKLVASAMPNLTGQVACMKDANAGEPCAREFITKFGLRAFRRPLVDEEVNHWLGLYKAQREPAVGASFTDAIRGVTMALLQSPNFLYRRELAPGAAIKDGNFVRFNSYEMASRLSYSFWATMPDARLFELAAGGKLQSTQAVREEARRLLLDPKAKEVYTDFAAQWLNLAPVVNAQKVATHNFTPEVGKAMLAEAGAFLSDLFMAPGTTGRMDELFTSKKTFVDSTLASIYGVQGVSGNAMSPVTLDGKQRSGFFTQLAFLTMHGDSDGSFPVRRGAEILRRVLCTEVETPPDMVIPDLKPPSPGVTTRQRFEEHSKNACATCHLLFDPIGFAFENYDGIGRYRTTDNGQPVDSSGNLPLASGALKFKDAVELLPMLANAPEVRSCMATQWTRYLLRREETKGDMPSLEAVEKAFRDSSYDLRELLVAIVTSDSFMRRTPAAGEVLP
jgi:Protein of unknown function (DUF1592)/Protein of unknown function (DUF1588)/Protein of unknown function (DUF1595)/Protein of unknown function (DUF1585)/Protein of unknown function (DUF1587)